MIDGPPACRHSSLIEGVIDPNRGLGQSEHPGLVVAGPGGKKHSEKKPIPK